MNKVLGCLLFLAILCLLLVISGYIVLMHTSLPAKAVAEMLNSDPNIDIKDISGSANKGFTIGDLHFKHGNSEFWFEGLTFRYSGYGDLLAGKIIIYEISMKSGKAVMDFEEASPVGALRSPFQPDASEAQRDQVRPASSGNTPAEDMQLAGIKVFRIDLISFTNFTVQNLDKSVDFVLDEARVDNILAEDGVGSMGEVVITSNMLSFETKRVADPDPKAWYERDAEAVVRPAMHKNIRKDIRWEGEIAMYKGNVRRSSHTIFDGALRSEVSEDSEAIIVEGLTLRDYFHHVSAPDDLRIRFEDKGEGKTSNSVGSFQIGGKVFAVAPLESASSGKLIGTHSQNDIEYTATITFLDKLPVIRTDLASEPAQEPPALLGNLMYGKTEAFSEDEQAKIDELQLLYFQPPEPEPEPEVEDEPPEDAESATDDAPTDPEPEPEPEPEPATDAQQ
jgi:hypothetical protein